jgi:hypothetical protein
MPVSLSALVAVSGAALAAPSATTTTELPLTRVTLYTSGVGFFERRGAVSDNAVIPMSFTVDQVNDVLKSLVLLDYDGGSIDPITFSAQDPITKELQAYSVDLSDNPNQETLLTRLRGAKVTLNLKPVQTSATTTVTPYASGVITSVEHTFHQSSVSDKDTVEKTFVTVFDDGADTDRQASLQRVDLADVEDIKFDDPALAKEIGGALSAIARSRNSNRREIDLSFRGKGKRGVYVSYVTEAPVWKASYRLLIGKKPLLQGWGIIENTSNEDWSNVSLTLVSGRPISFIQDLYSPLYLERPRIGFQNSAEQMVSQLRRGYGGVGGAMGGSISGSTLSNGLVMKSNNSNSYASTASDQLMDAASFGALAQNRPSAAPFSLDQAQSALNASLNSSTSKLGDALFSYSIPLLVNVPRGKSAMIPFFSASVDAARVGVFNNRVDSKHPLSGVRLKNTSALTLRGGPATVLDGVDSVSYSGDAILPDLQPAETKLITYAVDAAVDANVKYITNSDYWSISIHKGVLKIKSKAVSNTTYSFDNKSDSAQTIVVEHPDPGDGWVLIDDPKNHSAKEGVFRFDVQAPAGKETSLDVKFYRINLEEIGIVSSKNDTLIYYAHLAQVSDKARETLEQIVAYRAKIATAQATLDSLTAKIKDIEEQQEHIRGNMRELSKNDSLYIRYVKELDEQETKYNDIAKQRDAASLALSNAQAVLDNYLNNTDID